jgi:Lrp/AsnC family transcriptional regulator, leucine-responsive regulatory protein
LDIGFPLLRSCRRAYIGREARRFLFKLQIHGNLFRFYAFKKFCNTTDEIDLRIQKPPHQDDTSLDAIDRRILRVLQSDGAIANQALADEIGLSPPACLKRVRRLRAAGAIERTVTLLAPGKLGYPLLTVVRIKLDRPQEAIMREFERRMRELPRVAQCVTVAGDIDYIILVRSKDVAHYQDFARQILATAPGIRSYTSEVVLEVAKWTTEIPVEDA